MDFSFIESLILILIGLLFFRDEVMPFILKKLGIKKNGNAHATSEEMQELKHHYNHETTELLTEINEGIKDLNRKHEEYEKYGIKTRQ